MQVPVSVGKQQSTARRTEARLEEKEPSPEERVFLRCLYNDDVPPASGIQIA